MQPQRRQPATAVRNSQSWGVSPRSGTVRAGECLPPLEQSKLGSISPQRNSQSWGVSPPSGTVRAGEYLPPPRRNSQSWGVSPPSGTVRAGKCLPPPEQSELGSISPQRNSQSWGVSPPPEQSELGSVSPTGTVRAGECLSPPSLLSLASFCSLCSLPLSDPVSRGGAPQWLLSSLQQGRRAVWCFASFAKHREMFSGTLTPTPTKVLSGSPDRSWPDCPPLRLSWGLLPSCNEQLFALENLTARLWLSFWFTTPGPPYSSLHIIGASWTLLGLEISGKCGMYPWGKACGGFRKISGTRVSLPSGWL
ncbi:uncharacterized protein LOC119469276 [Cebus imitator]|uniref:uncharacterized protein LOC119469276 n=1 Tax=Cebus imitator TaxID=2715852 RepID=UPI001898CB16|nr:uncharacterized protein LOC119469276 [Cebus imitator]